MISSLSSIPKNLGPKQLPFGIRGHDLFGKKIALELPDIQPGYGYAIEFANFEDLKIARKQIAVACLRLYGSGRVQTASNGNVLFVWLKAHELEISYKVRAHVLSTETKVSSPVVSQETTAQGTDKSVSYD